MRTTTVVIASVLVLTGCMSTPGREGEVPSKEESFQQSTRALLIRTIPFMAALARPVRLFPVVYVDNSKVIVDQEPVHVLAHEGVAQRVVIQWSIGDSGYYFPDDGVVITVETGPPPIPNPPTCLKVGQPATTFVCLYKRPRGKSRYSYTIKVTDGTTQYTSDPYIAND